MAPPITRNTKPSTPTMQTDTPFEINTFETEPTLKQVMSKLNDIIKAIDFHSKQQEEALKRLANIEKENVSLRQENTNLNIRLSNIESFFYQQQQQQLQKHITIHGVPKNTNEDLNTTIINTIKSLNITVNQDEIITARRMHSTHNNTAPPIIVVEFTTTAIKQNIMQTYKTNGPIMLSQLSKAPNTENKKIYFNEYLNNYYKQLYNNTKELKSSNNFKFVWFKHGTIYARESETTQIYRVKHQNDITRIKNNHQE